MALKGKYRINIYGSLVTSATALKAYLFNGDSILDVSNSTWDQLPVSTPAISPGTDHELNVSLEIPGSAITWGVSVDLDITFGTSKSKLLGVFDLVYTDGTSYLGGLRLNIKADGSVDVLAE